MIKRFKVAGHCFSVKMDDGSPLWLSLGNYSPFITEDTCECVFSLEVHDGRREFERELIYSQQENKDYLRLDLYSTGQDLLMEMAPNLSMPACSQLLFGRDYKQAELFVWGGESLELFSINNALMILFAFSTARLNTLELHASTVVKDGRAYLFLARSGTGKSTHSSMWLKAVPGTQLLNDDNPVVRVHNDGSVVVYGSPWSGKTPCYRNMSAPAGAFVRIQRAPQNSIARQPIPLAYASLSSSVSAFRPDRDLADGIHASLSKIVSSVPCYLLKCLPDEDAARLCYDNVR